MNQLLTTLRLVWDAWRKRTETTPAIIPAKTRRNSPSIRVMMLEMLDTPRTARDLIEDIMKRTGRQDRMAISNSVRSILSLLTREGKIIKEKNGTRTMYRKAVLALPPPPANSNEQEAKEVWQGLGII